MKLSWTLLVGISEKVQTCVTNWLLQTSEKYLYTRFEREWYLKNTLLFTFPDCWQETYQEVFCLKIRRENFSCNWLFIFMAKETRNGKASFPLTINLSLASKTFQGFLYVDCRVKEVHKMRVYQSVICQLRKIFQLIIRNSDVFLHKFWKSYLYGALMTSFHEYLNNIFSFLVLNCSSTYYTSWSLIFILLTWRH